MRTVGPLFGWQRNNDAGAASEAGFDADVAVVGFDDAPDDGQA